MRVSLFGLGLAMVMAIGCGGSEPQAKSAADSTSSATSSKSSGPSGAMGTIKTFKVSPESLKADRVGGSDGALKPDNSPDLVFEADVEGPISALFLISTTPQGEPNGEYQADSITGLDTLPKDFPLSVRAGMLTAGMGVWEGQKMISKADGSIELIGDGPHHITVYVASTGVLSTGSHVRMYAMRPDKTVTPGPVAEL